MRYKSEFLLCLLVVVPGLLMSSTLIGTQSYDDSINDYIIVGFSDYVYGLISAAILLLLVFFYIILSEMEEKTI